jgi:hypothetical protein
MTKTIDIIYSFFLVICKFVIFVLISRFASNNEPQSTRYTREIKNPNAVLILTNIMSSAILLYFAIYLLNLFIENHESKKSVLIFHLIIIALLLFIMN